MLNLSSNSKNIYENILALFAYEIDHLKQNQHSFFNTPFEYKDKISGDSAISILKLKITNQNLICSIFQNHHLKENIILKTKDFKNSQTSAINLFNALYDYDEKITLSKLFISDKVMMYHSRVKKNYKYFKEEKAKEELEKEVLQFIKEYKKNKSNKEQQ